MNFFSNFFFRLFCSDRTETSLPTHSSQKKPFREVIVRWKVSVPGGLKSQLRTPTPRNWVKINSLTESSTHILLSTYSYEGSWKHWHRTWSGSHTSQNHISHPSVHPSNFTVCEKSTFRPWPRKCRTTLIIQDSFSLYHHERFWDWFQRTTPLLPFYEMWWKLHFVPWVLGV